MATGLETTQPIGHYEFCLIQPAECNLHFANGEVVMLTEALWSQLIEINGLVNAAITPATDQDIFGRAEVWFYPSVVGDCEDYVLLKRKLLAQAGWPLSALLITVVRKADGEGHAVLTVRTDRGDLILDNLAADIKVWNETPYLFVKRQSEQNTGRWVSIDDARGANVPIVGR